MKLLLFPRISSMRQLKPLMAKLVRLSKWLPAFLAVLCATTIPLSAAQPDAFTAFNEWVEEYRDAGIEGNQAFEEAGVELARERRAVFEALIVEDVARALEVALSDETRQELPTAVADLVEEKVSGAADLWAMAVYSSSPGGAAGGIARRMAFQKRDYRAYVRPEFARMPSQRNVWVEGFAVGDLLAVRKIEANAPVGVSLSEPGSPIVMQEEDSPAFGEKAIVLMRATFSDMAGAEPITEEVGYSVMEDVHRFLRENSFQQLSFRILHVTEEVVVLPGAAEDYLPQDGDEEEGIPEVTPEDAAANLMDATMAAAEREGYLNEYDFVFSVFPNFGLADELPPASSEGGVAMGSLLSGPLSFLLLESGSELDPAPVARLLGHNLGLWPSHYWKPLGPEGVYPVEEGRRVVEGNSFDLMGGSNTVEVSVPSPDDPDEEEMIDVRRTEFHFPNNHLSGNFKNILGWLPDENIHIISDEPSTETYRLFRLDGGTMLGGERKMSIRLLNEDGPLPPWVMGEDEETAERLDYWIDFRRRPFADADGNAIERVRDGVILQWGDGGSEFGSHLINAHPDLWRVDDGEVALARGETFSDPDFGLLVTPTRLDGQAPYEYMDVVVTRGTLEIQFLSPEPEPSVINPEGVIEVSSKELVELQIEATATTSPLSRVSLYVNEELVEEIEVEEDAEPVFEMPFTFEEFGTGVFELHAVAHNAAGNAVQSELLKFEVMEGEIAPTVFPPDVYVGQEAVLGVEGVEEDFVFESAEFMIDGEDVGTVEEEPFEITWVFDEAREYSVQVAVTEAGGRTLISDMLSINVTEPIAPVRSLWTHQESGTADDLFDIIFADGTFVAVGHGGKILTFGGTGTWSSRSTPPDTPNLRALAAGDGALVAIGDDGKAVTSTDGIDWSDSTSGTGTARRLSGVAYGPSGNDSVGRFVAVGNAGVVRVSDDGGQSWELRSSRTSNNLLDIAYGDDGFVAVGESGTIVWSEDGETWATQDSPTTAPLRGISFGDGRYVAVGGRWDSDGARIVSATNVSSDEPLWAVSSATIQNVLHDVFYGAGAWVAVGTQGALAASADGVGWSEPDETLPTDDTLLGIARDADAFVAVGHNGTILRSSVGSFEQWRSRQFSGEDLADPSISGPDADPEGTGASNLIRYALGIERGTDSQERLPRIEIAPDLVEPRLVLTYIRSQEVNDIQYVVEASSDLKVWKPIDEVGGSIQVAENGGKESVTATDGVSLAESGDRRFLRLRVKLVE